jgi:hypothetical protein
MLLSFLSLAGMSGLVLAVYNFVQQVKLDATTPDEAL